MTIIEIEWEGPFTFTEIENKDTQTDYGVYQIYGTHNVIGPDTLVYIGKTESQTFSSRMRNQDREWVRFEFHEFKFYTGKFGGKNNISDTEWIKVINDSERILIDFCVPPFNSQINNLIEKLDSNIVILNYGKRHKLPFTISTVWKESDHNYGVWHAYSNDKRQDFKQIMGI